jgi:hypothetical protein
MVEVGQTAPDFELPDQSGEPVRLSELRGQKVVVYFYPKADTPDHKYSKAAYRLRWEQVPSRSTFSATPRCYLVSASAAAIRARESGDALGSAELARRRADRPARRSANRRAYVGDTSASNHARRQGPPRTCLPLRSASQPSRALPLANRPHAQVLWRSGELSHPRERWHEQGPPQLKRGRSTQVFGRGA